MPQQEAPTKVRQPWRCSARGDRAGGGEHAENHIRLAGHEVSDALPADQYTSTWQGSGSTQHGPDADRHGCRLWCCAIMSSSRRRAEGGRASTPRTLRAADRRWCRMMVAACSP